MKTVRRLLYSDIVSSVFFVALAFLSLFYFIDFVEELDRMSRAGAGAGRAALLALLELPGHFYELFPIAVLIGSIYALARMAQSSEFTILRTGGLGPGRALALLATLGLAFAALTFAVGDYAAPWFERQAELTRAVATGGVAPSRGGAWLKDREVQGGRSYSIHVKQASANGELRQVRIFEFDATGGLLSRLAAASASVDGKGMWRLHDVQRTRWSAGKISDETLVESAWQSSLTSGVVAAAVLPPNTMTTTELYRYTQHLSAQEQSAQAYQIQFWQRAFKPLACLVMVALALPFAYLHARGGGISFKVFGGIMLGISFSLLNSLAGHLGLLQDLTPWAVAGAPSMLYLLMSLAAFGWLVRYR
ncbi:LPS export ABC transporter permease LptG [Paucibacter sp. JuS9]|uniref:LPS export ABC transporter permease LptG n=1 Tax=Paucibacter sp. JuS9 TaxID=3228748 RepID=UPI003756962E